MKDINFTYLSLVFKLASLAKSILYLVFLILLIVSLSKDISLTTFIEYKPVLFFIISILTLEIITNLAAVILAPKNKN